MKDKPTFFSVRKIILLILLGITLLGMGGGSYWYFLRVRPVTTLMTKAEQHLDDEEWGAAVRSLKRVLQLKPRHLEANILVGDILFQFRHPATQHFYGIAYEVAPQRWDVWKRLVDYHILMSDRYQAQQLIDAPPSAPEQQEVWWEAYFNFSLKSGDIVEARKAAEKLIVLSEEKQLSWDFVLAQMNAQQTEDVSTRAAGQERLLAFYRESPRWRHSAARVYVESLYSEGKRKQADSFIREWLTMEDVPFDDALFCLNLVGESNSSIHQQALTLIQSKANTGERVSRVMQWLLGRDQEKDMWVWMNTLEEKLVETPEVFTILSVYCARKKDWITLKEHLLRDSQVWVGNRSLYHLYSAYMQHQQMEIINVQMLRQAAREAGSEANGFARLKQGCIRLGWKRGWDELLPFLMYETRTSFSAGMELYREAVEEKRYEDLLDIATRSYSAQPDNYAASNNFAYLSLIYGQGQEEVHAIALKNYQQHPQRVNSIVTYLLSLWRQKKDDEAIRLLGEMVPEMKDHPSVLYGRALVLATRMPAEAEVVRQRLQQEMFSPAEWDLLLMDPDQRQIEEKKEEEVVQDKTESLKSYVEQSGFRRGWAARTLIQTLMHEGKESDAYDMIKQWLEKGDMGFEDAFFSLTTIRAEQRQELAQRLLKWCQQQSYRPEDHARLTRWMFKQGQEKEAFAWLETLDPVQRESVEVLNVLADYYIENQQWELLETKVLKSENMWSKQMRDYYLIKAAAISRTGKVSSNGQEVEQWLRQAVETVGNDLSVPRLVQKRLAEWGWEAGWTRFNAMYMAADDAERQRLERSRERQGGRPVLAQELEHAAAFLVERPENPEAEGRLAYYHLIGGIEVEQAHDSAQTSYQKDPTGVMPQAAAILSAVLREESERAVELVSLIPTRWSYHPTLLLVKVLALQATDPEEANSIQNRLDPERYTKEEWELLQK